MGSILHIETIQVKSKHRRQNIATKLLERFLDAAYTFDQNITFCFAWPYSSAAAAGESQMISVHLFRKSGFRRVGDSHWFCRSTKDDHPSRQISAVGDFNPEKRTLSELGKLEQEVEKTRTVFQHGFLTVDISDKFRGHSLEKTGQLLSLRGHVDPGPEDPINTPANARFHLLVLRTKFGCTCNQCVAGYLSPRACHVLKSQAEILYDMLSDAIDVWMFAEDLDTHVPQPARANLHTNKSMRTGYAEVRSSTHFLQSAQH